MVFSLSTFCFSVLCIVSHFKWFLAEFQLLFALFTLLHIVSICKIKGMRESGREYKRKKKQTKNIKTKDLFSMISNASGNFSFGMQTVLCPVELKKRTQKGEETKQSKDKSIKNMNECVRAGALLTFAIVLKIALLFVF